jgi:hypothetical protein
VSRPLPNYAVDKDQVGSINVKFMKLYSFAQSLVFKIASLVDEIPNLEPVVSIESKKNALSNPFQISSAGLFMLRGTGYHLPIILHL